MVDAKTENEVLVSIITPCYNAERYIGEAIDSVLNQSYQRFELIIINDGSTDNSENIIKKYQERDNRIKLIQQTNCGVAASRNKGMEIAKGEYIAFLDADDVWKEENLKIKIETLQSSTDIHWVFSDIYLADENLNKFQITEGGSDKNVLKSLLSRSGDVIHAPSNLVIKKECIRNTGIRFDLRLPPSEDLDFCIQLASCGFNAKRIARPLLIYRVLKNSLSRNLKTLEAGNLLIYKKHSDSELFRSFGFKMRCLSNTYLILGGSWWVNGKNKTRGLLFILRSIIIYPPNILKILNKIPPYNLTSPEENSLPEQKKILIRLLKKKRSLSSGSPFSITPIHILLFHRINPTSDPLWNPINPGSFEKIVAFIKKRYDIISLEEHFQIPQTNNKKPLCAITFDDGYKDYIDYALPILSKYKCPASMYIVTDCINRNLPPWTYILNHAFINTSSLSLDIDTSSFPEELRKSKWRDKEERLEFAKNLSPYLKSIPNYRRSKIYLEIIAQFHDVEAPKGLMLSWNEINELGHNNTNIGSHSATHPVLSQVMHNDKLSSELKISADEIEKNTGKRPVSIAYPFGLYNSNVKSIAEQTGYKFAFTTVPFPYTKLLFDNYEIPRIELFNESFTKSKLRISGAMQKINELRNIFSP
jgi:glycosyltransferase involved in cell wall biosynthesis